MCKLLLALLIAAYVCGTFIISYLIVGAIVIGIVWEIYAACFNFIHRDEIKRNIEKRIEELNAPYRDRDKAFYRYLDESHKRENAYCLSRSKVHNK